MVNKAIRVARARAPVRLASYVRCIYVCSYIRVYSARICHARACGFKHARTCGLALVLTPIKGREPSPGMEYNAYTECDTLLSLSIMHS